jgi:hypothetical protein
MRLVAGDWSTVLRGLAPSEYEHCPNVLAKTFQPLDVRLGVLVSVRLELHDRTL